MDDELILKCDTYAEMTINLDMDEDEEDYEDFSLYNYVYPLHVEIFESSYSDDDNDDEPIQTKIGFLEAFFVDACQVEYNGLSLSEVVDAHSQPLASAVLPLLDCKGQLKSSYSSIVPNVVHLDKLYIHKDYRGHGYARVIMEHLAKFFVSKLRIDYGCFIMEPSAFELEENADSFGREKLIRKDQLEDGQLRTERLRKFYESCGFKAIRGSSYMYKVQC